MTHYIIIRGPLGCGKSTIAESLAKKLRGKHIAYDRILDDHKLTEAKEEGMISRKSFLKANEIVIPDAKKILDSGKPVIFDGNFYWKEQIEDLIEKLDYKHYVFTLKASLEVCTERDSKRSKTHGKWAAMAVHNAVSKFDYGTVINNEDKIADEAVEEIMKEL